MAMNLSLNKLPWYSQLGAFAVLALAGVAVFWNFYVRPAQMAMEERQGGVTTLRNDIQRGLLTARRLPEFRRQVADLQAQLERLRPVLPSEKDVADLLRRIQAMATQSNLTIRGFAPQAVATRTMYAEWPIGLQIEGTYHNLGGFLERVSKFPRLINITGIHIKAKDNGTPNDSTRAGAGAPPLVRAEPKPPPAPAAPAPAPAAGAPK